MSIEAYVHGFLVKDYHTETAATPITEQLPAVDGCRLVLKSMQYLAAATAHMASFMYANGAGSRNTASVLALSGQKNITCTDAPKDPAGNAAATPDVIAYQLTDGTWEFNTIASIAGSIITLTNNIVGVDAGAGGTAIAALGKVMVFGVVGDNMSVKLSLTAATLMNYGELAIAHPYVGEPFYLSIDNATNAGFLHSLVMAYINK